MLKYLIQEGTRDSDQGFVYIDDQPTPTEAELQALKTCVDQKLRELSRGQFFLI